MKAMTIMLDDDEIDELSCQAREARMSEQQLIQQLIRSQLQTGRHGGVPRYARRVGPLVLPSS